MFQLSNGIKKLKIVQKSYKNCQKTDISVRFLEGAQKTQLMMMRCAYMTVKLHAQWQSTNVHVGLNGINW